MKDKDTFKETFCQRLKLLRLLNNMQQKDVAKSLGIKPSTYGMYERGEREPSLYTLYQIADFFNVSADYLLGLESNAPQNEKHITMEYLTVAELLQRQNVPVDILIKVIESLPVMKRKIPENRTPSKIKLANKERGFWKCPRS